jgi:hypothetical protein
MKRLSVKPKRIRERIELTDDSIRYDDARRLRNALSVLIERQADWMDWVDRWVPRSLPLRQKRVIVERQARLVISKNYKMLSWGVRLSMIYSDYYFTDGGSLKMYY